jgi:hypothetical protein
MIYPNVKNWQELQDKVCLLLNQVGFEAETNKKVSVPRGNIDLDVYAVDPNSIDKIEYIIECKNWEHRIPQTIIHSFTSVMNETGGNIGYIISKNGFQKGAFDFVENTNIKILTFEQLQERYSESWLINYFYREIDIISRDLKDYTDVINSSRDTKLQGISEDKQKQYVSLFLKYKDFGDFLVELSLRRAGSSRIFSQRPSSIIISVVEIKEILKTRCKIMVKSEYYNDLLTELKIIVAEITSEFEGVFTESNN